MGIESLVIGRADPDVGALQLLAHGAYYAAKHGRLSITTGFMATESQAPLSEYARRTGRRPHLAESSA